MYVASNSLPSYAITKTTFNASITSVTGAFQNFNTSTLKYSILSFPSPVPFVTGDEVVYSTTGNNIIGLPEGSYFVKYFHFQTKSNSTDLGLLSQLILQKSLIFLVEHKRILLLLSVRSQMLLHHKNF